MNYTISSLKLRKVFNNFMDNKFNLRHNGTIMLASENGEVFGYIGDSHDFYVQKYPKKILHAFFGDMANDLLIEYLKNKFPDKRIDAIV